jgi:hypothetical protein
MHVYRDLIPDAVVERSDDGTLLSRTSHRKTGFDSGFKSKMEVSQALRDAGGNHLPERLSSCSAAGGVSVQPPEHVISFHNDVMFTSSSLSSSSSSSSSSSLLSRGHMVLCGATPSTQSPAGAQQHQQQSHITTPLGKTCMDDIITITLRRHERFQADLPARTDAADAPPASGTSSDTLETQNAAVWPHGASSVYWDVSMECTTPCRNVGFMVLFVDRDVQSWAIPNCDCTCVVFDADSWKHPVYALFSKPEVRTLSIPYCTYNCSDEAEARISLDGILARHLPQRITIAGGSDTADNDTDGDTPTALRNLHTAYIDADAVTSISLFVLPTAVL